jgi:hypothetical protein
MMTISPVFLILNDTLIDPALDALHGLQPDRLNAFPAGRQSHALHNPEPQCAGVRTDCDDYSSGAGAAGARDADAVGEWVLNASVVKQSNAILSIFCMNATCRQCHERRTSFCPRV